jgi:2-octaprenyl-6-methoxyphenol hydroxylase
MSGRAQNCDCLVIGAGPVGALLASVLARTGRSVVLAERGTLERKVSGRPETRGYALSAGSVTLLDDLGYWSALAAFSAPIREVHVTRAGTLGSVSMDADSQHVPALGQVVPAATIDSVMAQALREAGVQVLEQTRFAELAPARAERRQVTLEGSAGSQRFMPRLVVAADGAHSATRAAAGIEALHRRYDADALVFDVRPARPHQGRAFERFTPEGPLALLPQPGGSMNVVWVAPPAVCEARAALPEAERTAELQARFGWRLGRLEAAGPLARFPLELIRARRLHAERLVLAGNVAHGLHPVAGQGLNLSLRDVAVLAALLQPPGDPGAPERLARYEEIRTPDVDRVVAATDFLARRLRVHDALSPHLLGGGLLLLDRIELLRSLFAEQAMGLDALPRRSLRAIPPPGAVEASA